jgi:hypothetical protein
MMARTRHVWNIIMGRAYFNHVQKGHRNVTRTCFQLLTCDCPAALLLLQAPAGAHSEQHELQAGARGSSSNMRKQVTCHAQHARVLLMMVRPNVGWPLLLMASCLVLVCN